MAGMTTASGIMTTLAAAIGLVLLGGCYEHVVRAEGPAASKYEVFEPNLKEDERVPIIDDVGDAMFGKPAKKPEAKPAFGRPVPRGP